MSTKASSFFKPSIVFPLSILLRLVLLAWGRYQDTHSPLKYTDIDYLVFTDAARYVSRGRSPYDRDTYRYTPLLAWLLYPTTYPGSSLWFDFGKLVFATGDIVTGWLIYLILTKSSGWRPKQQQAMTPDRALKYASIWLLNPMVANISTRGSSEGLLAVLVVALLWATLARRTRLAGVLLGLGVHFKIYPFVYAASVFWWLGEEANTGRLDEHEIYDKDPSWINWLLVVANRERLKLGIVSFGTFMGLFFFMLNL